MQISFIIFVFQHISLFSNIIHHFTPLFTNISHIPIKNINISIFSYNTLALSSNPSNVIFRSGTSPSPLLFPLFLLPPPYYAGLFTH